MRITGSKVHRVWKCPASAALPQLEGDDSRFEPARDRGKGIHAFLENVKRTGRSMALAEAPKELNPLLEALDLDNLPVGLACEVAFAWNWKLGTARELGRSPNLPRRPDGGIDYDALGVDWSCEIPCTLDVVGVAEVVPNGFRDLVEQEPPRRTVSRGYVGDYKSGHVKYPAPDMFGQTLLGALCVRSVWGCDDVVVELIHIHDNGGHHTARRTVTDWELDTFERELHEAMSIVAGAEWEMRETGIDVEHLSEIKVSEGSHCDYCPAFKACPAKIALVRSIPEKLYALGVRPGTLPDKDGVEQHALVLTGGALTIRKAAEAWTVLELVQDVINRAKEEICSIAAFEEIPLPDGRVIGRLITERRGLNGRIAAEVLEQRFGRAARDEYVDLSVTMSGLRQAAVKYKAEGEKIETKQKTGAYDKLLAEVERLGGVEVIETNSVKPHVPKKQKRLPGVG